jgi:hypothetical protein
MVWIKRNLFFAIGTAVALLLLAAAVVYSLQNWSHNRDALIKLNETYNTLRDLKNPSNDKVNNIEIARGQQKELAAWLAKSGPYFQPIPPIPNLASNAITSKALGDALHETVSQLTRGAEKAGVLLPPRYSFSFEAEQPVMRFAPAGVLPLAQQLGEVKAIAEIMFAAKVNALDSIQRVRVSDDDVAGQQLDYLGDASVTNEMAVLTPYVVTFRGFSHELAQVVAGFATSPNGFIVRAINIEPAAPGGMMLAQPDMPAPNMPSPSGSQYGSQYGGGTRYAPQTPQPAAPVPGRGGLPTVLNEQLLRITMSVQIVKLLPKNKP